MSTQGFERIDDVLLHLTQEMDASLNRTERKRQDRIEKDHLEDGQKRRPSEQACPIDGPRWMDKTNMNEMFDRMNGRFEDFALRLRP